MDAMHIDVFDNLMPSSSDGNGPAGADPPTDRPLLQHGSECGVTGAVDTSDQSLILHSPQTDNMLIDQHLSGTLSSLPSEDYRMDTQSNDSSLVTQHTKKPRRQKQHHAPRQPDRDTQKRHRKQKPTKGK